MEAQGIIFASTIVILLLSVIIHEVMHGLAARWYGDHTAEAAGRLTLNPIPHVDLFGTIIFPLLAIISHSPIIFGWAKPVPVNPLHFSNIRQGQLVVALAGVVSNLAIALIAAILFHTIGTTIAYPILANILSYAVHINLVLAVFNMIPIPPLDGSKVLMTFMNYEMERQYASLEKYGLFIILGLWLIPFGNSTVLGTIVGGLVNFLHSLLSV